MRAASTITRGNCRFQNKPLTANTVVSNRATLPPARAEPPETSSAFPATGNNNPEKASDRQ